MKKKKKIKLYIYVIYKLAVVRFIKKKKNLLILLIFSYFEINFLGFYPRISYILFCIKVVKNLLSSNPN